MALPTIETAINTTIVKQTIGVSSNNVGTLCLSSNINKWSKYKPVRYANVAPIRGVGSDWWMAADGNCGLNIPNYPNMAAMFTALRAGTIMWDYLKPGGGATQPYRLADFAGYEHTANPPLVPMQLNNTYYATLGTMGTALDQRVQSIYELTVNDIGKTYNLGAMYFGVAICKQGTTGYKYMTENVTMGNGGGGGLSIPINGEMGTYDVVYFLAATPKASFSDPDKVNTFIPIPNAMQVVNISNSPITVYVSGSFALMTAYYEITIVNNYPSSLILNGCNIAFRYGNKAPEDALVMGEKNKSLGTVTVQGNSSVTLTGNIAAVGADYASLGGYLYFSNLTNTAYNKRGEFEA